MFKVLEYNEGMKIEKPCVVRGMPCDVYHKHPALSNSGLKTLIDCPAKYYYKYLSGEYEPKEKPYFKIGKAAHCFLLEGRKAFEEKYWTNPYKTFLKDEKIKILQNMGYKNAKKLKVSEIDEVLLKLKGIEKKEIELTQSELNQVICLARAAMSDKKSFRALTQKGEAELSIFWFDEKYGLWFKCRPDFLPNNLVNVPDYKTSDSANPAIFYKKFIDYGYHIQGAMYRRGIKAVLGVDIQNFFFIVQEKEAPYITQIFNPAMNFFMWGDKAIDNAVEIYKECQETGIWGGYSDKIIELTTDPQPDYLTGNYDKTNGIIYAPYWIDRLFEKYEA